VERVRVWVEQDMKAQSGERKGERRGRKEEDKKKRMNVESVEGGGRALSSLQVCGARHEIANRSRRIFGNPGREARRPCPVCPPCLPCLTCVSVKVITTTAPPHLESITTAAMKLSGSFVVSTLLCTASAASKAGRVFVYDPVAAAASPQHPTSANPQTARLILTQRLGLSRFHSIKHADDGEIQLLNAYGGRQQKLFGGEDQDRTKAHVLVWVDDVELVTGSHQQDTLWGLGNANTICL
jgi:hypothetical protein